MIKNLTPHEIRVVGREDEYIIFPPSGEVARVSSTSENVGEVDGIPISVTTFGDLSGLPAPEDGVVYLVSLLVRQAAQGVGRIDVVSPDTGPTALRENGQVVAVRGFCK
jgi:hypothetical protein